jgi:DNA-binding FadR family transcriptional regulator
MIVLTQEHKNRLREINEKLKNQKHSEALFTGVEIMFYEAIAIARDYGNDLSGNRLLADLKYLESNQYRATQVQFRKSRQREQKIKSFIRQLVGILTRSSGSIFPHKVLL